MANLNCLQCPKYNPEAPKIEWDQHETPRFCSNKCKDRYWSVFIGGEQTKSTVMYHKGGN